MSSIFFFQKLIHEMTERRPSRFGAGLQVLEDDRLKMDRRDKLKTFTMKLSTLPLREIVFVFHGAAGRLLKKMPHMVRQAHHEGLAVDNA